MISDRAAHAYLGDAELILQEAESSQKAGHYHRVARKCQESSELAAKGLLRLWGIEYPKSHLLGRVIKRELVKRKIVDRQTADQLAYYLDSLSLDREPAFYGSPEGIPAGELFDEEDGQEALMKARWVLETIRTAIPSRKGLDTELEIEE